MSEILFSRNYIAVVPTYEQTNTHKHNMLHLFVGDGKISIETENGMYSGKVIILEQNVVHRAPQGKIAYFLFIDATSEFADFLRNNYFHRNNTVCLDTDGLDISEFTEAEINDRLRSFFDENILMRRSCMDKRISMLLDEIDSFKYPGTKVSGIAEKYGYSESYFTHLFKNETGVPLKNYMLMRQLEFAWLKISRSEKITDAVLDAGFSSSSHFSDLCQKLMGISALEVLKKADL